jgi:hypothetical protein
MHPFGDSVVSIDRAALLTLGFLIVLLPHPDLMFI